MKIRAQLTNKFSTIKTKTKTSSMEKVAYSQTELRVEKTKEMVRSIFVKSITFTQVLSSLLIQRKIKLNRQKVFIISGQTLTK